MKRQLRGIALILLSITLMLGSLADGWRYVFDLDLHWQHIFAVLGIAGAVLAWFPDKKGEK